VNLGGPAPELFFCGEGKRTDGFNNSSEVLNGTIEGPFGGYRREGNGRFKGKKVWVGRRRTTIG